MATASQSAVSDAADEGQDNAALGPIAYRLNLLERELEKQRRENIALRRRLRVPTPLAPKVAAAISHASSGAGGPKAAPDHLWTAEAWVRSLDIEATIATALLQRVRKRSLANAVRKLHEAHQRRDSRCLARVHSYHPAPQTSEFTSQRAYPEYGSMPPRSAVGAGVKAAAEVAEGAAGAERATRMDGALRADGASAPEGTAEGAAAEGTPGTGEEAVIETGGEEQFEVRDGIDRVDCDGAQAPCSEMDGLATADMGPSSQPSTHCSTYSAPYPPRTPPYSHDLRSLRPMVSRPRALGARAPACVPL